MSFPHLIRDLDRIFGKAGTAGGAAQRADRRQQHPAITFGKQDANQHKRKRRAAEDQQDEYEREHGFRDSLIQLWRRPRTLSFRPPNVPGFSCDADGSEVSHAASQSWAAALCSHADDVHRFGRAANASRSCRSEVRTVPAGSACATTSASTAEPRRARLLSSAARRASASGSACVTSQVLRNPFSRASRLA
jgi:hypothetical protein